MTIRTDTARDRRGKAVRTPAQMELDHKAAELKSKGLSYRAVAQEMGWASSATAYDAVQRAIEEIPKSGTAELVALEVEKLDAIERKAYEIITTVHPLVSMKGDIITRVSIEEDGELKAVELIDDSITLKALDTLLKVADRRAKLLGLNAPTNIRVETVAYDPDAIDAEFLEFKRTLALGPGDSTTVLDGPQSPS